MRILRLAAALLVLAAPRLAAQPRSTAVAMPVPALDAAARRRIVDSAARVLEARYPDRDTASLIAVRLRAQLAAGAYEGHAHPQALGEALMRDLQGVVPDRHLRVSWEPGLEYALAPAAAPPPSAGAAAAQRTTVARRIDPRDPAVIARTNFAFRAVERFPGNVGYLKLERFVPSDLSRNALAAAMGFLAGSDAVILDLRDNVGGAPDLVELVASWFLPPEPVTLVSTYSRAADRTFERRSVREVPGPRLPDAALYILVNRNSASSAEMLPYALQRLGRATVVGERTAGAGNGGGKQSVGAGITLFVPMMRIVSGPGYERTGVRPDVATSSDSALPVARRLALERLVAVPAAAEVTREREWALEHFLAESRPLPPATTLARYAGRYGTALVRTVHVAREGLVTTGSTGWVTRLVPSGTHAFRAPDARYRFECDPDGRATALVIETIEGRTTRLPRLPDA